MKTCFKQIDRINIKVFQTKNDLTNHPPEFQDQVILSQRGCLDTTKRTLQNLSYLLVNSFYYSGLIKPKFQNQSKSEGFLRNDQMPQNRVCLCLNNLSLEMSHTFINFRISNVVSALPTICTEMCQISTFYFKILCSVVPRHDKGPRYATQSRFDSYRAVVEKRL